MVNIDNYNKVKEIEERINKEGIDKVIEDFIKNPYKLIENCMIIPERKSNYDNTNKI